MRGAKKLEACRISKSENLVPVLDLGQQYLTGVFPGEDGLKITSGPLGLVWCPDSGLLQLSHSYDLGEMYGSNYGYRSGLNPMMVKHLSEKVEDLLALKQVGKDDLVLDIGSNDGTLLGNYEIPGMLKVGIDPTGAKFSNFYKPDIVLIPKFFNSEVFKARFQEKKAEIITSISMFYDLEDPNKFVSDVSNILAPNGIWHFEQSYLPLMLQRNAYDTVCHEHLEYYSLAVVKKLLQSHGLKIVDVQLNDVNGGSFAVTATHENSIIPIHTQNIDSLLESERLMSINSIEPYLDFQRRVAKHRIDLTTLIKNLVLSGKKVVGYGASTKGNVLLQYCGLSRSDISCIAELNPDKFGCFTPGTNIPILPEEDVKKMRPDYMLVLPWHFRDHIIVRESEYLASGGKLIFPLPEIEIV